MSIQEKSLINTVVADRYLILKEIGSGGMATVYLAEDKRLKRKVAIKSLTSTSGSSLKEAHLLAKINHQHIVQIYDAVVQDDVIYIVMEYAPGKTLNLLQKEGQFTAVEKLTLLTQICSGMVAAHQKGIIHCDLKPSNIIVDQEHRVKISDFGIARLSQASEHLVTRSEQYLSIGFSSPELILQQECDHRSDLFSFGILAYQLIYGIHPFGEQREEHMERILAGEFLQPSEAMTNSSELSSNIAALLCQLLQAKPEQRPNSSRLVLEALEQELSIYKEQLQDLTCLVPAVEPPKNNVTSKLGIIGAFSIVIISLMFWFGIDNFNKLDTRYVVVAPPKLVISNEQDAKDFLLLKASVENAIRQSVINTKKMELIANNDFDFSANNIEQIGLVTKASDIVIPTVNCNGSNCNVRIEALTSPDWRVSDQVQWDIAATDHLSILNTVAVNFATMYQSYNDKYVQAKTFTQQDYIEYLRIYDEVKTTGAYTEQNKDLLLQLVVRSPYLYEAYSLLQEVVLDLFYQQGDQALLKQLELVLVGSPKEFKATPWYAINQFYLSIELNNFDKAERQLQDMGIEQSEPYLHNILAAELALKQNKLSQAKDFFEQAIAVRRTHKALFAAATTAFQLGDFNRAIEYLSEVAGENTNHYKARVLMANIYLALGDVAQAIPLYEKEIERQAQAETRNNLAIAYSLNHQFAEALQQVRKIDLPINNSGILLNIADIEKLNGEQQRSGELYRQIVTLTEQDQSFYGLLDRAQALAQIAEYDQAISVLNRAIRLQPESSEYAFSAAVVYSLANEPKSALVQVKEAIKVGYPAIWFNSKWFANLCAHDEFKQIVDKLKDPICRA